MISLKKMTKFLIIPIGIILLVALLQAGYFIKLTKGNTPIRKADLIVVFPGDPERIAAGHTLAKAGYAPNLSVVNWSQAQFQKQMQRYGDLPAIQLITGGKSRSTFEDVYNAKQIISQHNYHSIVLVTSSYHLPRALFLLKTSLLGSGLKVDVQHYPVAMREKLNSPKAIKLFCNEIIKLWGSTAEMVGCRITDSLLLDSPGFFKIRQFIKTRFLFQV